MKVQCPTCKRSDLDSVWAFYVPDHASAAGGKPCAGGGKGTKPERPGKQLCYGCGKYLSRLARFCPRCNA